MNLKSITSKFTLSFLTGVLIISTVMFTTFYWLTWQIIQQQTDREISLHAQPIISLVQQNTAGQNFSLLQNQILHEFALMPGMLIAVSNPLGGDILTSQPLASGHDVLTDILEKSTNIVDPVFVDRKLGAISMRLGIFPVQSNGQTTSLVLMAHPYDIITHALSRLSLILFLVTIAVIVFGSLGSFFIVKSSLKPLRQLAGLLQTVESTNLNQHLSVPKSHDEIASLTETFNNMLSRLEATWTKERQFIGDIAHELKTPLSTLITRAELDPKMADNLKDLQRLSATVNDVLDLAWAESGETATQFVPVDLSNLTAEIIELAQNLRLDKKIKFITEVTPKIMVLGVRQKLFRAIFNLADNAVKYVPKAGKVAIALSKEKKYAVLEFSNTGRGINKEDLPLVFKRFYRGKNSKDEGTGLGLSICKSIIEAHHGSISVQSQPHKLTTFIVKLPILAKSS